MNKEPSIVIVNRGASNGRSIENALRAAGAHCFQSDVADDILYADGLVLPGVGSFPAGMRQLADRGLLEPIRRFRELGKPVLGICLGMQMFFERSSEGGGQDQPTEGFGWIKGEVHPLSPRLNPTLQPRPNIGWARVRFSQQAILAQGLEAEEYFYHLHSYVCHPEDNRVVTARTDIQNSFVSAVQQENLYGVQFHPERSSQYPGIHMLRSFVELCNIDKAGL